MTEAALRRDLVLTDALGDQGKAVSQRLWHLCAGHVVRWQGDGSGEALPQERPRSVAPAQD
eukprot:6909209-Pyramimonas_sp.AAC.1